MDTNLPPTAANESGQPVRSFFDQYFKKQITFPSNQIDGVVGFFLKRGFDQISARSTAIVLLTQARLDEVSVFELLDTMQGLTDVQMSKVVTEVLNAYRQSTSILGFKILTLEETAESRNIIP
jgi:hypothetical protein